MNRCRCGERRFTQALISRDSTGTILESFGPIPSGAERYDGPVPVRIVFGLHSLRSPNTIVSG